MVKLSYMDGLTPFVESMAEALAGDHAPVLAEVGEFMASSIKLRQSEQRGLGNGIPYKALTPKYADRKKRAGGNPARILYGPTPGGNNPPRKKGAAVMPRTRGGELAASWRRMQTTQTAVWVGAAGSDSSGTLNLDKAGGNDDRLDIAWNKQFHDAASAKCFDGLMKLARSRERA